jgi:hypothetical protein
MRYLLFSVFLLLPVVSFASVPDFPMAFWGEVTIDGVAAPAGSIVRVYDAVTQVGEIILLEDGVYGYTAPTKQKLIVGEGQGVLTFKIESPSINGGAETGGLSSIVYPGFVSGETVELNLTFDVTEEVIIPPSSSGSSSSGGGGGGSRRTIDTPTELVLGVSTSTESLTEEEQKIVLQKKLIELLTLLIVLLKQQMLIGTI